MFTVQSSRSSASDTLQPSRFPTPAARPTAKAARPSRNLDVSALYRAHRDALVTCARPHVGPHLAIDCAHDAFATFLSPAGPRDLADHAVLPWLLREVRRRAIIKRQHNRTEEPAGLVGRFDVEVDDFAQGDI